MSFKTLALLVLCTMTVSLGAACGDDGASGRGGDGDGDGVCEGEAEDVPSYDGVAAFGG